MMLVVLAISVVFVAVAVAPPTAKHDGRYQIDDEANHSDQQCLIEADGLRSEKSNASFPDHQHCDDAEDDRAGERGERSDLAGAERVAPVIGMLAGISIGESCDTERGYMSSHMETSQRMMSV